MVNFLNENFAISGSKIAGCDRGGLINEVAVNRRFILMANPLK